MSRSCGKIDAEARLDVPTMMKLLMAVYNNVRDDGVMDEVAEAVGDAICMLGDMRKVAQDVANESADACAAAGPSRAELDIMFAQFVQPADPGKIC